MVTKPAIAPVAVTPLEESEKKSAGTFFLSTGGVVTSYASKTAGL